MMCMSSWSSQEPCWFSHLPLLCFSWINFTSQVTRKLLVRPRSWHAGAETMSRGLYLRIFTEAVRTHHRPSASSLCKISYNPGRTGSHYAAQIGLNSWSSCLYLPSAGIAGVCYSAQFKVNFWMFSLNHKWTSSNVWNLKATCSWW